uniref:IRS-type PTB domain-containing protein n=1 Tax=Denticeps clupeoides TaxID=299321 RepID=A0AAY4A845_9TELE
MGSCWSCLYRDSIQNNHPNKFKVTNVDDEGNELGSGIMELTQTELILHTRKRDAIRWPYLCLRRYGYDSNLFSFESGRRCQTGQGIFAFKCSRAEEIFNLLQELMQCNSINVVEEPMIMTHPAHPPEMELTRNPQTPNSENLNIFVHSMHHPHPAHVLHVADGSSETEGEGPALHMCNTHPYHHYHHVMHRHQEGCQVGSQLTYENINGLRGAGGRRMRLSPSSVSHSLGSSSSSSTTTGEVHPHSLPLAPHPQPSSSSSVLPHPLPTQAYPCERGGHRRTALLNYENLPSLPPVWEYREGGASGGSGGRGIHRDALQNYVNTEQVQPPRLHHTCPPHPAPHTQRPCQADRGGRVFSFDFRRRSGGGGLNYIQVDLEGEPPRGMTPASTPAPVPARRSEFYAVIDLKKTAAMSNLQKALPRDDGTSRKTRHNSTDLPL